jgi:hypothetical protein
LSENEGAGRREEMDEEYDEEGELVGGEEEDEEGEGADRGDSLTERRSTGLRYSIEKGE